MFALARVAVSVGIMGSMTSDEHKQRLLTLKAELLAEGDNRVQADDDGVVGTEKPDEDAQPLAEMSKVIASSRNRTRKQILDRVLAALVRLEQDPGSFGECVECGEKIPDRRLTVMPYVELCVECQSARDPSDKNAPRRHLRDFK